VKPKAEENFDSEDELPVKLREHFEIDSRISNSSSIIEQIENNPPKDEIYSDLIFPFNKPSDYYTKKPPKKYSGKLVKYDKYMFKNLDTVKDLLRFKLACLKEKASVAENEGFQVGTVSEVHLHEKKNYLKLTVYIGNKSDYNRIESFSLQYVGNSGK
jgi:small nuclear ribonucleoprotein (snRNP)-like protein